MYNFSRFGTLYDSDTNVSVANSYDPKKSNYVHYEPYKHYFTCSALYGIDIDTPSIGEYIPNPHIKQIQFLPYKILKTSQYLQEEVTKPQSAYTIGLKLINEYLEKVIELLPKKVKEFDNSKKVTPQLMIIKGIETKNTLMFDKGLADLRQKRITKTGVEKIFRSAYNDRNSYSVTHSFILSDKDRYMIRELYKLLNSMEKKPSLTVKHIAVGIYFKLFNEDESVADIIQKYARKTSKGYIKDPNRLISDIEGQIDILYNNRDKYSIDDAINYYAFIQLSLIKYLEVNKHLSLRKNKGDISYIKKLLYFYKYKLDADDLKTFYDITNTETTPKLDFKNIKGPL
jgi:hypothetical protein